MSIIITIIINITVLLPHNIICFEYFMPLSHDINNKVPPMSNCLPPGLHLDFPGFFVVLEEILYQPSFAMMKLLQKTIHFHNKTYFFFQLISGRF